MTAKLLTPYQQERRARFYERAGKALRLQESGMKLRKIGAALGRVKDPALPVTAERARQMANRGARIKRLQGIRLDDLQTRLEASGLYRGSFDPPHAVWGAYDDARAEWHLFNLHVVDRDLAQLEELLGTLTPVTS